MNTTRIVVGGEALVDLVPTGDGTLAPRLGGGPFTVAVAAGRLGAPVSFLSRVSTDAFGEAALARLEDSGVDTALVQRGPEPTTLAVVGLADDGSARYTFYTEGTADRLVTDPGPLHAALGSEVAAVSLGTLSLVLEPGASTYEAVLHREAAAGCVTVLDPNIRPVLIPDAAAYRARFRSWLPSVGLLTLSVQDAEWLAGPGEVPDAVRGWLDAGVTAVVLTRGGEGLEVCTAAHRVGASVPAAPVTNTVDTIGAGDTVHGALLAWLHDVGALSRATLAELDPASWAEALSFAARAATVTVSRAGADPPWLHELAGTSSDPGDDGTGAGPPACDGAD